MPDYTSPTMSGIVYSFTTGGYSAPTMSGVPFQFGLRPSYQQTADLKSVIEASSKYSDSTLGAFIRPTIQTYRDLGAFAGGHPPGELPGFIRPTTQDIKDLGATLDGKFLHGEKDLGASTFAILPKDLQAIINIIELRNLPATIVGDYLKGYKDLGGFIDVLDNFFELPAYINQIYFKDLQAVINWPAVKNLGAEINPYAPADLPAYIRGWLGIESPFNLQGIVNGVYGPYDLQAYLNTIPPKDLGAYIKGYKGIQIPFDLRGSIEGWYSSDLGAILNIIHPADLGAFIEVTGSIADLGAYIRPRTILLKKALYVPLLEHKDLWAVINFQCFNSGYINLGAYTYAIHKQDLGAYIAGFWADGTSDSIVDLGAKIGVESYMVQDTFNVSFFPEVQKYTRLNVRFGATQAIGSYTTWDTIEVLLIDPLYRNLGAEVFGMYRSRDLGAEVYGIWDWNYSQLPEYIRPRTNEVFIDLDNKEEQLKKFVKLMFDIDGNTPFNYFYVDGTQQVYRVDRSRHWTLWAESYDNVENNFIERANVRRKHIFKLNQYTTMDEAVRDLMTRVAEYARLDLSAYINGGMPPHLDLNAVLSANVKYRWNVNLRANIDSISISNLNASITAI